MKKYFIFCVIVALITFFSVPAFVFGDGCPPPEEEKDAEQYTIEGQEVYCLDDDTEANDDEGDYEETGDMVSDALQVEGGNGESGIPEVNAEAVEILCTTATGATDEENQDAVWDIIEGDTPPAGSTVEDVVDAAMEVAQEFLDSGETDLQQYLDDENVNEVEVLLDEDPLVDGSGDYSDFTASAVMENPLVPGVTDEDKTVYWYILAGSYNVSFSDIDLVTEITDIMVDNLDTGDDFDTDGVTIDDTYGLSQVQYYFYWWGEGYPEFEEMNVCLFAWVDIDEDCKLDIQDLPDKGKGDPDGDVVEQFMKDYQVIMTQENQNMTTAFRPMHTIHRILL